MTFGGEAVLRGIYELAGGRVGAVIDVKQLATHIGWEYEATANEVGELGEEGYVNRMFGSASLTPAGAAAMA
jgi:hypothetical protein